MAGAFSGTALIGAAVVAFVLLVSLQALRDWPLADIGSGSGDSGSGAATRRAAGASPQGVVRLGAPPPRRARDATHVRHRAERAGLRRLSPDEAQGQAPSTGGGPSSAGGSGSAGSAGSASGGGSSGGLGQSPSGAVTGAANGAVSGVDEATGGALGETGVTKAAEETVNGVVGPESTVGKTVDGAVGGLGKALGPGQ